MNTNTATESAKITARHTANVAKMTAAAVAGDWAAHETAERAVKRDDAAMDRLYLEADAARRAAPRCALTT